MAGDWIKMRMDLVDDPAVIWMAEQLGMPEPCIVGYLHTVWSWASRQCNAGSVTGVTLSSLQRISRCSKIPELMLSVGWLEALEIDGKPVLRFPNWERHNSQSAKQRALTKSRVDKVRASTCNAASVTKALPEKRREEKSNTPYKSPKGDAPQQRYSQDFERWWLAYPKRVGKDAAARAFRVARTKVDRDELQQVTERYAASPKGRGEFCWNPATWLNQAHWLDDPA